ncbi:hypothetical protein ACSQ67_015572 [Phaseolus vulgaris]
MVMGSFTAASLAILLACANLAITVAATGKEPWSNTLCNASRIQHPQGGIPIPNANGANPTVNGVFGIPLGTGLAGTSFAPNSANNNQNNAQLQLGPDGLGLSFGTITVIDDMLTSQPEEGSQLVGKAQGVYVASSADGTRQMMAFTALFEGGEYGDSLNFYGLYKIGSTMSRISVLGGQGSSRMQGVLQN